MADNVNRQSLITSLADRYKNQNIGGAYNANKAGTSTYHNDNPVSFKAQTVDNSGEFFVNQPIGISNFKGTEGQTYNEISEYGKGVGTSTYNALNLKSQKSIDFNKNSEFQLGINQQSPSNFKGIEHEFDSATIKEQSSLAQKIGTSTYAPESKYISSKAQIFDTNPNFVVNQPIGISNFKGTEGQTYNEISDLAQRVGTSTYNGIGPESQKSITFNKDSKFQLNLTQQSPSNFGGITNEFDSAAIDEQSSLAQKIGTSTYAPDSKYISYNARTFAKTPNFVVKQPLKVTNFKGIDDNKSLRYNEISSLAQGFNNNKYKP